MMENLNGFPTLERAMFLVQTLTHPTHVGGGLQ